MSQNISDFVEGLGVGVADLLWSMFQILLIFMLARLVLQLISGFTRRGMESGRYHKTETQGKRMDSIMTLARSTTRYLVYGIAIVFSFGALGVGDAVSNMIVTAGIGSVAIGFGAQSLVKDVVTGFFMMFENQFSVGDLVKMDEHFGFVEATAMRVTYLRTFKGEQVVIPNGTITRVINYTRGGHTAVITAVVPYELDIKAVMAVMQQALDTYCEIHKELLEDLPFIRGITKFETYGIELTASCKVKALQQWEVERGMRMAVKEAFDAAGIHFAYPRMTVMPYTDPAESFAGGEVSVLDNQIVGDDRHWKMGGDEIK